MHAIWNGLGPAPSTSGTQYIFVCATLAGTWYSSENASGFGESAIPLSDAINITKITFYVTNAPSGTASWTFKLRKNASTDTTAAVTITGSATSATWSGTVPFSQLDLIGISSTPAGSPAAPGNVYWTIEYDSIGSDYYLALGQGASNQTADLYASPFSLTPWSGTATDYEVVVPTDLTVIKIAGGQISAPGNGGSYNYTVRKNNTTDAPFTAIVADPNTTGVSSTGSLAFTAGDRMVIKRTRTNAVNWLSAFYCITIVPTYRGEVMQAFGNLQQPSTTATCFEAPKGIGANAAWNATEASVYMRIAGCTLQKLYVALVTATGAGATRAFTLRSNVADTPIVATLTNASTGSDMVDTATHGDGNFLSVKMVPTASPAATSGVKVGYVQVVAQPSNSTPTNINQAVQRASLR
jgi:hypothetical protein